MLYSYTGKHSKGNIVVVSVSTETLLRWALPSNSALRFMYMLVIAETRSFSTAALHWQTELLAARKNALCLSIVLSPLAQTEQT